MAENNVLLQEFHQIAAKVTKIAAFTQDFASSSTIRRSPACPPPLYPLPLCLPLLCPLLLCPLHFARYHINRRHFARRHFACHHFACCRFARAVLFVLSAFSCFPPPSLAFLSFFYPPLLFFPLLFLFYLLP
ncbi:hypothetical protein M5W83_09595 [Paenibacillus thiaminolyticus]|uniref:Uncharacterized protein n=1 Tax=Paenibacillus thiaminolyticus TaxID=49283 RepID=A0AAP9DY25_PANTH|nr:hypothetical protein [Paenibacillus thiaminolyticus]MCY9535369.1 hypothetical protein [Paenibacillus thiaminolyticus]MCY9603354.1 hypothetical protein [Paenibacillus thiaminolyticus]MCY9607403.1 hypothetical protein [Paenibacillus thiaminolyticus]MCY9616461.1 hypothetical protein [Paenibacillus thiaminolyticus]MCY9621255.1 hypothetical protein [Paenibacillus thiaminolyticus]